MRVIFLILLGYSFLQAQLLKEGDTVRDTKTKLVWQDSKIVQEKEFIYSAAKEYCKNLTLAKKSDWRLPTLLELETIVDYRKYKPAMQHRFYFSGRDNYWTSTLFANDKERAWAIDFKSGAVSHNRHSYDYFVRCVRQK